MNYNAEFDFYISSLTTRLLKNYYYPPQTVLEILTNESTSTPLMLKNLNFSGTLFVVCESKKVNDFVENQYKRFIPKAKIVLINKRLNLCLGKLPRKVDLLIANNILEKLVISEVLNQKDIRIFPTTKEDFDKIGTYLSDDIFSKRIEENIKNNFLKIFETKKINFLIFNNFKTDKNTVSNLAEKIFNDLKLFINEEECTNFLKNINVYKNQIPEEIEKFQSIVQNTDTWIIGKLKEDISLINSILKDDYYSILYKRTKDLALCKKSGFVKEGKVPFSINLLTTPLNKIKIDEKTENPVVLLSIGSFNPLGNGHILMFKKAKNILEANGFNVTGAFISPINESFIKEKENFENFFERLNYNYKILENYDWINIDLWQSLYAPQYINFTTVISRLEKYLQEHVRKDIRVVYVCGDNEIFHMNVFKEKGLAVCVEKDNINFDKISRQIFSPNIFYVKDAVVKENPKILEKNKTKIHYEGVVLLNDDGTLPFLPLNIPEKDKQKAQKYFLKECVKILEKYIPLNVKVVDLSQEIKLANKEFKNKNTLSLSPLFSGTYKLDYFEKFDASSMQEKGTIISFEDKDIKKTTFTLVDEKIRSQNFYNYLNDTFNINKFYFLNKTIKDEVFLSINVSDLMFSANNQGFLTNIFGDNTFIPFIYPYVNIYKFLKIKDPKSFTRDIIRLNINMYKQFLSSVTVNDLSESMKIFFTNQDIKKDLKVFVALSHLYV